MWYCGHPECNCKRNWQRCMDGDRSAAEDLARTLTPLVDATVREARRHLQSEEQADVRQDTFFRMLKGLATWRGDCPFCLWVRQIAIRAVVDQSRLNQRLQRLRKAPDSLDGIVDQRTEPLSPQVLKCVQRTFEQIPDDMRRVYELHVIQGKTIEETAKAVGKSVRTIGYWLDKIRKLVLACLD